MPNYYRAQAGLAIHRKHHLPKACHFQSTTYKLCLAEFNVSSAYQDIIIKNMLPLAWIDVMHDVFVLDFGPNGSYYNILINGNSSNLEFVVCALCSQASYAYLCLIYDKFINHLSTSVKELVSKGESSCTAK